MNDRKFRQSEESRRKVDARSKSRDQIGELHACRRRVAAGAME